MNEPETAPLLSQRVPLAAAALLIPLYAEALSSGALASWAARLASQIAHASANLPWLLPPGDESPRPVNPRPPQLPPPGGERARPRGDQPGQNFVRSVEDALRHLDDYAYLAGHALAGWRLVQHRLSAGSRTSLDRGKAVYDLLAEAIEKLRPAGKPPADPPPRVWHPYLILHGAYLANTPNREIMCRLYVSEGTFNRTRRAALQAVTRWLEEMEAALEG